MTAAIAPLLVIAAELLGAGAPSSPADAQAAQAPAAPLALPGQRQHRSERSPKRGIHELKDPSGWPAEPAPPAGPLDAARFDAALVGICGEVTRPDGLDDVARLVREISVETGADPFLIGALAYRQSRCQPRVTASGGVGLLLIEPRMFAADAPLPFPRADLDRERLLDPARNLRVGIALLEMWGREHETLDRIDGSTPHRTAVAHLFWGDHVWSATPEDRVLAARRRLLARYAGLPPASAPSPLGLEIVSPLEGAPRLGTSGPGADRDDGARAHRGLDVDAAVGEPVRAVADGVVQFAGADMPGQVPARDLAPRQLRRWRGRNLGPGGFFVRVVHEDGIRTGYFHLNSYRVVAGQVVHAGEVIGSVGRTGVKVSGSHLHFEVHKDGELGDPVGFLSAYVLPPDQTITHELAMAEKRLRLARERRHRRHARVS